MSDSVYDWFFWFEILRGQNSVLYMKSILINILVYERNGNPFQYSLCFWEVLMDREPVPWNQQNIVDALPSDCFAEWACLERLKDCLFLFSPEAMLTFPTIFHHPSSSLWDAVTYWWSILWQDRDLKASSDSSSRNQYASFMWLWELGLSILAFGPSLTSCPAVV